MSSDEAKAGSRTDESPSRKLIWLIVATLVTTAFNLAGTATTTWWTFAHNDEAAKRGRLTEACMAATTAGGRLTIDVSRFQFALILGDVGPAVNAVAGSAETAEKQMSDATRRLSLVSPDQAAVDHARRAHQAAAEVRVYALEASGLRGKVRTQKLPEVEKHAQLLEQSLEQLTASCRRQVI